MTNHRNGSQVALEVKNLPADAGDAGDTGDENWEDPPEEEMATHSSILASRIPWTEKPGRPWSTGSQELDMTGVT